MVFAAKVQIDWGNPLQVAGALALASAVLFWSGFSGSGTTTRSMTDAELSHRADHHRPGLARGGMVLGLPAEVLYGLSALAGLGALGALAWGQLGG